MQRILSLSLAAAIAAASIGVTAAQAQQYYGQGPGYNHGPGYGPDHGPEYGPQRHDWHRGDRYYGDRQRVDWHHNHLRPPPPGYEWVQDNGQFVLIGITSGVIADILLNR